MANEFEREFDDQVYEDDYYDEHYEEEELIEKEFDEPGEEKEDEEDLDAEEEQFFAGDEDIENENVNEKVHLSFACEDCDYRWEETIFKKKDELDYDDRDHICPMCGSMSVTQI